MAMTKLLTFFVSPLGVLFLLLVLAVWWIVRDRRWCAGMALVMAMAWIYAWSSPVVAVGVTRWWEKRVPATPLEELPEVEVAVILGGGVRQAMAPYRYPDLNQGGDRPWHAARLYHAGKAERVLISGSVRGEDYEAETSESFLTDLGVPKESIIREPNSRNTIQNALESAAVLEEMGVSRILLVTSATHMPRSIHAFRHAGLDPIPAPTDFQGVDLHIGWRRWLPTPVALLQSSVTIKELVGTAYYRLAYRVPSTVIGDR